MQPCSSSYLSLSNCSGLEAAAVSSEAILPAELLTTTLLPVNIVTDTVANFNFRAPIYL